MLIVASGDWHLDKQVEGYDLHKHIERAAESVVEMAADADLFVHLGDLFHTQRPSPRAYATAIRFLGQLTCPVILLQGNHDVGTWLPIVEALPQVAVATESLVLDYSKPVLAVPWMRDIDMNPPEDGIAQGRVDAAFADARRAWEDEYDAGETQRVQAVFCHLDVRGALLSSGVPMESGTLELPADVAQTLPCPVVNGHLHRRQRLGKNVWMPGGLVPFDMGERDDGPKGALILEV